MPDYNRTIWKDHIKDQNGIVIQQGVPVSAKNLNNIENQIVALSAKENTLAELVRESIPSGFTSLSDIDYTYMSTNPNTIKLTSDSAAFVNGYKVVIPAGTVIALNAPPATGTRDDLVFLECWKQTDDAGAISWNSRIRVVDGVDFSKYPEGLGTYCPALYTPEYRNLVQGANSSPITEDWNTTFKLSGRGYLGSWVDFSSFTDLKDLGLYVSGRGESSSKNALKTTDGYVYAIPLFRVKRRNSSGYSVVNANGAVTYKTVVPTFTAYFIAGTTKQFSVPSGDYDKLNVNDTIVHTANSNMYMRVISKDGGSLVTFQNTSNVDCGGGNYYIKSLRPDKLYVDIVDSRDIIDLRHQVSLTGFNYQQLLEENFDKLLRGELQTTDKTTMLKTYHGISKTPIDANTVFYASFDGTTVAEVGGATGVTGTYGLSPTGLGIRSLNGLVTNLTSSIQSTATIDMILTSYTSDGNTHELFAFKDANNLTQLRGVLASYNMLSIQLGLGTNSYDITNICATNLSAFVKNPIHIRLTINGAVLKLYINGRLISSYTASHGISAPLTKVVDHTDYYSLTNGIISDFAVSNIDRGAVFATLPQDFIDGYARIAPAFNEQRNVFSDALTSETSLVSVKCAGGNGKHIVLGDSTDWLKDDGSKWNTGDRVKVKGLGGEIISGVIDPDTALATILGQCLDYIIPVDDVSKFSIGDSIGVYNSSWGNYNTRTITSIDTTNKTITLNAGGFVGSGWIGGYIVETTASSSSPTVKTNLNGTVVSATSTTLVLPASFNPTDDAYNGLTIMITSGTGAGQARTINDYTGSTKTLIVPAWTTTPDTTSNFVISGVPVAGTWSGLGTNEAVFTLGTLYALTAQDIYINYGLNEIPGQGGISEVLTATLAGESNGKKLVVNPTVHVRDDLAGKVAGSVIVNPNIGYVSTMPALQSPLNKTGNVTTGFMEYFSADISTLNGVTTATTATANGSIPQQLFSFNLIRIIEDKFGTLPCPNDTASKVTWLKANISKITCNWWGYGSCPSGNKAFLELWNPQSLTWITWNKAIGNTSSTPSLATPTASTSNMLYIDANGFVHFLAYTDASDGTASTIYTDYVNLEATLTTPTGYDVLTCENPRRDDGKGNILLVRKETKEIVTMFTRSNTDGIVTYGDYVPMQSTQESIGEALVKADFTGKLFLTSNGTGGVVFNDSNTVVHLKNFPLTASELQMQPNGIISYANYAGDSTLGLTSCIVDALIISPNNSTYYPSRFTAVGMKLSLASNSDGSIKFNDSSYGAYQTPFVLSIDKNKLKNGAKYNSFRPMIVSFNGALYLIVMFNLSFVRIFAYKLKNRPLIK